MSDYFRALLLGGPMREQQESHVDLKALSAKSVENMVDFLYSGTMHLVCVNACVAKSTTLLNSIIILASFNIVMKFGL